MLVSCEEKLPENKVYPYETQLISIKILNAGADGNTVVEGTINQDKKEITFPKLDKDSPFDKLRVEATASEGAEITETVYDYPWRKASQARLRSSESRTIRDTLTIS